MHVPHSIYCEYKNHEKEGFYMSNGDTVKLLRECNAGTKMAVYSMDEICDKISDADFKNVIMASKEKHERLGNEIHAQLEKCDDIIARIKEAAQYVDINQLCLSPQCGFASTEEGNILTEEQQWKKLDFIRSIVEEVWGK